MNFRCLEEWIDFRIAMIFLKLSRISHYLGMNELKIFLIECGDSLAGKWADLEAIRRELESWNCRNEEEFEISLKEFEERNEETNSR